MHSQFESREVSRIIDQALIYQCACPAQVCSTLIGLRDLHAYQQECLEATENDRRVHEAIARAAEQAHTIMEQCLRDVLVIEGWDLQTLSMPDALRKKPAKEGI